MRRGQVDLCLVGTDRCSAAGDVCNKIGTYLKALAARDCGVPFHVCAPSPSIDWSLRETEVTIEIEERGADEILWASGPDEEGVQRRVRLAGEGTPVCNPAFDLTPARLISGLVTERGACPATPEGLATLFPERASRPSSALASTRTPRPPGEVRDLRSRNANSSSGPTGCSCNPGWVLCTHIRSSTRSLGGRVGTGPPPGPPSRGRRSGPWWRGRPV